MPKLNDTPRYDVDLSFDQFASALRPNQEALGITAAFEQSIPVRFAGLIGEDDGPDTIRVYLDYELNTYVQIERKDIMRRERVKNASGLDVSMMFVKHDAIVTLRELASEKVRADALSQALIAAESGAFPSASGLAFTPATPTITRTITIATALVCTKILCSYTSRHSLICSIACTNHPACPNPWTKNWFC